MRHIRTRAVALTTALTAAAFMLAAGSSGAATGRTLFVDRAAGGCSDSGSGTLDQPFCTITAAARAVGAGETVQVAGGTYSESVTVPTSGTSTAPITFTAAPGATVTLTGATNGPVLSSGFVLAGRSWVKVAGFSITKTSSQGISVRDSSHITLSDNHVSFAGRPVSGQTRPGINLSNVSDSEVSRNTTDHNSNYGLYFLSGSTRNLVKSNTSFSNAQGYQRAASGIRFDSSPGNTIAANSTYANEDSGIEVATGSQNNLIFNNLVYNNGDHGIDDTGMSPNTGIIGNTVYHNVTAGIDLEGDATGSTVYNNIAVDNGVNSPRTWGNIRVYSSSTVGTTLDYNLVYHTVPGQSNYVWGSDYDDLSVTDMRKVSGQEMHAIQADPMWTSPSTADFSLRPGSPAIDSASSGVLGASSTDANDTARTDDPLTANTGVGPRGFDDRGPLEYKPRDAAPHPSVSVTPSPALVNQAVTADASASYDDDGTSPIASYRFDFGDGSGVAGPQSASAATHTYTRSGTYSVTVYVSDTAGRVATDSTTVKVGDAAPSAALSLQPSTGPAPLAVSADASASTAADGTSIASYAFDWGDGSPTTGPQPGASATHVYATAGSYVVTVTVTDTAGQTGAAGSPVTVKANVVGNPGFESATSGWNTSGSATGVTLVRVDGGHTGTGSAKLATAGTSGTCTLNDAPNWVKLTLAAGTRYTASVWVRGETAGATLKLRVTEYNSAGANLGSVTQLVPLTTAWQKASVNYSAAAAGSSLDLNAYVLAVPANTTCFYADDAAIFTP